MKILLGSHGVGKTTLLEAIKKYRPSIYVSDGFSRPVKEFSLNAGKNFMTPVIQQELINELTTWRWLQDSKKNNCVFSRSIIDAIIYTSVLFPEINTDEMIEIFRSLKSYNIYFYIPIEFSISKDEQRPDDLEFQKSIDDNIQSFIRNHELPIIKIQGTVIERFEQINQHL